MTSPCINCRDKRKKTRNECTKINNYCKKLIDFRNNLDSERNIIRTTSFNNEYPIMIDPKRGIQL